MTIMRNKMFRVTLHQKFLSPPYDKCETKWLPSDFFPTRMTIMRNKEFTTQKFFELPKCKTKKNHPFGWSFFLILYNVPRTI